MLLINKSTVMSATYFAYLGECVRTSVIRSFCLQLFMLGSTHSMHWLFALDICSYSVYSQSLIFASNLLFAQQGQCHFRPRESFVLSRCELVFILSLDACPASISF